MLANKLIITILYLAWYQDWQQRCNITGSDSCKDDAKEQTDRCGEQAEKSVHLCTIPRNQLFTDKFGCIELQLTTTTYYYYYDYCKSPTRCYLALDCTQLHSTSSEASRQCTMLTHLQTWFDRTRGGSSSIFRSSSTTQEVAFIVFIVFIVLIVYIVFIALIVSIVFIVFNVFINFEIKIVDIFVV